MTSKKFLIGLCTLLLLTSCITKAIWSDKSYEEKIEQFFIGSDQRYVVLISEKYHYVFTDNSGLFKKILSLKQKGVLTLSPKKTHLKLSANNDISGDFVLEGPFDILPAEDRKVLRNLGVVEGKNHQVSIKIRLAGKRYLARYLGQGFAASDASYEISIYYSDSNLVKDAGKVAITPIAVTLDAVLLIGKVVISPLVF